MALISWMCVFAEQCSEVDFVFLTEFVLEANLQAEGNLSFVTEWMKFVRKTKSDEKHAELVQLAGSQMDECCGMTPSQSLMDGLDVQDWWTTHKETACLCLPLDSTNQLMLHFGQWSGKKALLEAVCDSCETGRELFAEAFESVQFESFHAVVFLIAYFKLQII